MPITKTRHYCKYCNIDFDTYKDAFEHEETCDNNPNIESDDSFELITTTPIIIINTESTIADCIKLINDGNYPINPKSIGIFIHNKTY